MKMSTRISRPQPSLLTQILDHSGQWRTQGRIGTNLKAKSPHMAILTASRIRKTWTPRWIKSNRSTSTSIPLARQNSTKNRGSWRPIQTTEWMTSQRTQRRSRTKCVHPADSLDNLIFLKSVASLNVLINHPSTSFHAQITTQFTHNYSQIDIKEIETQCIL